MIVVLLWYHISISIHALLAESDRGTEYGTNNTANFYPRSPCGERPPSRKYLSSNTSHFYPRSPCGERPCKRSCVEIILNISIHALLAESDLTMSPHKSGPVIFLSTLSLRRATVYPGIVQASLTFLSTLSLRRATDRPGGTGHPQRISIHALLAESDVVHIAEHASPGRISIHALLAESDIAPAKRQKSA